MEVIAHVFRATWQVYLLSSPYILLGLAAAGLLHVLIPPDRIARWLGRPGFGGVTRAALLGIPLPLCSCAVVPVTIELSRKGASRESSLAFLVSTPETGVDSIFLTYGLMGPVMAVFRPLAALATSLVAAGSSMLWPSPKGRDLPDDTGCASCELDESTAAPVRSRLSIRRAARYGFGEMVDEIGFWLLVGLILTGVITALMPGRWLEGALGQGPAAMLLLLVMGVPLYMCASASTPIGAALLLKGVSPGAVLVFLLAGPATNASSLVVIARFFGRRFVVLYLSSVVVTALVAGWMFDVVVYRTALEVVPQLTQGHSDALSWLDGVSATILGALLLLSALRGSWRRAIADLVRDLRSWKNLLERRNAY